jgi:hypothetical protein
MKKGQKFVAKKQTRKAAPLASQFEKQGKWREGGVARAAGVARTVTGTVALGAAAVAVQDKSAQGTGKGLTDNAGGGGLGDRVAGKKRHRGNGILRFLKPVKPCGGEAVGKEGAEERPLKRPKVIAPFCAGYCDEMGEGGGKNKGEGKVSGVYWRCSVCTFHNKREIAPVCEMCSSPRCPVPRK